MTIGVLGGGAWGTALAAMAARESEEVVLWARDSETVASINTRNRNPRYLGEIDLPANIKATSDMDRAADAQIVLCVTPAQSLGGILPSVTPKLHQDAHLILCAKGIDRKTGKLPHELAADHLAHNQIAALSGPSFAHDVARGLPTAVSLSSGNLETASKLAQALSTPVFRIYATDDMTGVEIGGALKNVLAIAVGVARGLELGASAEAALIARGFAELERLAMTLGGRRETLTGLSGLGDLVLTCSSPQSRNFAYGIALATGIDLKSLPLAEGVHSAEMALQLAKKNAVETPIVESVCALLAGELTAADAVAQLLARPLREE